MVNKRSNICSRSVLGLVSVSGTVFVGLVCLLALEESLDLAGLRVLGGGDDESTMVESRLSVCASASVGW